jgi:hypothetical protein
MARGASRANSELDRFGRYNPLARRGDAMEDAFGFNYNQRGFFDRYVKQMAGGPYTLERIVNTFRGNLDGPENRQLALAALKAMEQSTVSSAFKQANELRGLLRIPRIAAPGSRAESEAGEKLGTNSITPPKNIPKGKVLIGVPLPDGSVEYSMSTKEYPYVIVGKYPEKGQSGGTDYGDKHGKWAVAGMVGDREKAQKFLLTQQGKRNQDVDMRIVEPTFKRREDA